jgi:hypothetical protein
LHNLGKLIAFGEGELTLHFGGKSNDKIAHVRAELHLTPKLADANLRTKLALAKLVASDQGTSKISKDSVVTERIEYSR